MSRPASRSEVRKLPVRVHAHSSPPPSTPRSMPVSPDMIPAFSYEPGIAATSIVSHITEKPIKRSSAFPQQKKKDVAVNKHGNFMKKNEETIRNPNINRRLNVAAQELKIPLNINKPMKMKTGRSVTLTNLSRDLPKQQRKVQSSRDDERESKGFLKMLSDEFPPYNPSDFMPKVDESVEIYNEKILRTASEDNNKELLQKIRQELVEWMAEKTEVEKPQLSDSISASPEYIEETLPGPTPCDPGIRVSKKENVPKRETVAIQTTPPRERAMMNLPLLDNPNLAFFNVPDTPSPLTKSNALEIADHLLSVAERKFAVMESKLPEHTASNQNSARYTNEPLLARRTMTDYTVSPTKGSVFSDNTLQSRSKASYNVPQNSPCTSCKLKIDDKYMKNNGEKKSVKHKTPGHSQVLSNKKAKSKPSSVEQSGNLEKSPKSPAITQFSMFYKQQKLVEKKSQNGQEKNSATVIFKSDAKVISSTNAVVTQDVETNTDPEIFNQPQNIRKNTPNSSIISMRTSKLEEEDHISGIPHKIFNIQKMPSVNIRPGFTIHSGPKINIVASTSNVYKPKRRNTEFFDVVYPPNTLVSNEPSILVDKERQLSVRDNHVEHVCERHAFPSGKLIPGSQDVELHETRTGDDLSIQDKKRILLDLIKSVLEKVEKQARNEKKNCCRLICSFPLLASVVKKIQVDCKSCVNILHRHLDRLIQLMKEELRSYKELSEDHCCLLDETVQYLIVELELIQEENTNRQQLDSAPVTAFRHQENEGTKISKKSVSFESIPGATAMGTNTQVLQKSNKSWNNKDQNILQNKHENKSKSVLKPQQFKTSCGKSGNTGNVTNKIKNHGQLQQLRAKIGNNATKSNILPNSKETVNISKGTKEKTVVGKVMKSIMNRKPILKNKTTPKQSLAENSKTTSSNAFYKIIDNRETSNDFDEWIQERSQKIKLIHEELSKMVSGSMDSFVENSVDDYQHIHKMTEDRDEYQGNKIGRRSNKEKQESVTSSQVEDKRELQNSKADHQELSQDYAEDFEEDIEEAASDKGPSSDDSHERTLAEFEVGSSSSSDIDEEVGSEDLKGQTSEEGSIINEQPADMLSDRNEDVQNKTITTLKQDALTNNLIKSSVETEDKIKETYQDNYSKVDVATSPINNNLTGESTTDISMAPSTLRKIEVERVSIATSPISIPDKDLLRVVKSTTVQTDNFEADITKMQESENNFKRDNMQLTVPSVKLKPSSLRNSLQVTLNRAEENSLAMQANPSNQTVNLIVHLPDLQSKTAENIRSSEAKDLVNQNGMKLGENSVNPKQDSEIISKRGVVENKTPVSSKSKDEKICTEDKLAVDNDPIQKQLTERTIKDIIEPTVSEVLKKLNVPPTSHHEIDNNGAVTGRSHSDLVKPSFILQTKHGQWKECEKVVLDKVVVDSSNQTEAEKQSVHIQVAPSLVGSTSEKSISAVRQISARDVFETSFLKILQPPPPRAETVTSSITHSSTCRSSSTSSSSTSISSRSKEDKINHREKLSEGEIVPETCACVVGEVCTNCVPKLDLSCGELKTKRRNRRRENIHLIDSDSDLSENSKSQFSLSKMPLHLEPRPSSTYAIAPLSRIEKNKTDTRGHFKNSSADFPLNKFLSHPTSGDKNNGRKMVLKPFSQIANSVINDLNIEYLHTQGGNNKDSDFPKLNPNASENVNTIPLNELRLNDSSSDSLKSSISSGNKCSRKTRTKTKKPLVIKCPLEKAKIDVVIEGSDVSASSYQTSVTSVSVENLPGALILSSHSSSELHHSS
ncbi:uncharacterized protein LOC124357695 isoform X2 [Homalodisca vitripennis]|uniref:uncharacterized protein LOC124357695 isoform X2 n=1 Tax=Homalodisca vitripennis TaxID=197043 RepID=UPI001EE9E1D0|nr:uncharacterized protein LOC124357695 isoform X2 [Homalodisca vitripennis]